MDLMKNLYRQELAASIASYSNLKPEDFQHSDELRTELKQKMEAWLSEKLGIPVDKQVKTANRKYFSICMAELVYESAVRPNLSDFLV